MKLRQHSKNAGFDRIACVYHLLEAIAFGPVLQRARTAHLGQITEAEEVLLAGEGNGRFLKALLDANPHCRVTCMDASPAMLRAAQGRIEKSDQKRVHFQRIDLTSDSLPANRYDALVTHFFLDCFKGSTLIHLLSKLECALRQKGKWLLSDFVDPQNGKPFALLQGTALRLLYCFFRRTCGIEAHELCNTRKLMLSLEMRENLRQTYLQGWIASFVYEKALPPPCCDKGFQHRPRTPKKP